MRELAFAKMSGAGNDFIVIDNRLPVVQVEDLSVFAARVCARRMSVGADGLILLEESERADFKWQFFNADGSRGEMCGNGARCAARFAYLQGWVGSRMAFETDAGIIKAEVENDQVKIEMTPPSMVELGRRLEFSGGELDFSFVNTGVPHVVVKVDDLAAVDVLGLGREIRNHEVFQPAGTNVNFIACDRQGRWAIRTYERGVEEETLACGTGSAAAALVLAATCRLPSPVSLRTASGETLKIHFTTRDSGRFDRILLEGGARIVYQGTMLPDAWEY